MAHSAMASPPHDFGVVFDIDGVLVRGGKALPHARAVLESLREHNVPYLYLTNNGGWMEDVKAAHLSDALGIDIDARRMIQSHTPMRELVAQFGDKRVLIMGSSDVYNVARQYGFTKVVSVTDLVQHYPSQAPFHKYEQKDAPHHGEPIEAIIMLHDAIDWGIEIQVAIDVLIGGDPPGSGRPDGKQTPLFVSNDDFTFSAAYPHPRFAQGAFTKCLRVLYESLTGKELQITRYGKPETVSYRFAESLLNELAGRDAANPIKRIYGIGDNPHSDIQGANNAGDHWTSILVRTGVYDGTKEPDHTPDVHAPTVLEAIQHIYKEHGLPPL